MFDPNDISIASKMDLLLLVLLFSAVNGFNIDTSKPVIFDHPGGSSGKYFGYSLTLHTNFDKKWVLVSAPLDDVRSRSDNKLLKKYGAVYKCDPTTSKCTYIPIDDRPPQKRAFKFQDIDQVIEYEKKTDQWLGQVLHSTGKNGRVLTCAPRFTETPPNSLGTMQYRWIVGRCFEVSPDLLDVKKTITPCHDKRYGNNYYGYCQSGFSGETTIDNTYFVMGAVGVSNWKGGIAAYSPLYGGDPVFTTQDQIAAGYYMGYSVASGYFGQSKKIGIAGGAPRAENMKGKVLIYQIDSQLTVSATLPQPKNAKMGSYFGSVLCAVDLDKDQYSDILVGAPYYSDIKDEGRVFVYMNNKNGALNLMTDMELSGDRVIGAKFGSAITNVGSINKDKYDDVAIGAPYEGNGAVYIYHGKANGIETKYRQKILASDVSSGLSVFGHSIAGGIDMDDNGYPDIAIGAYGSDKVVLLKSQKVINVEAQITLSVKRFVIENNMTECKEKDDSIHKCVNVTVCFKTLESAPTDLNISYKVELDKDKGSDALKRMYFYQTNGKKAFIMTDTTQMKFSAKPTVCLPVYTVHLRANNQLVDLLSVLTFDVSFDLAHSSCKTNPNELCSVLNDYTAKMVRAVATFQKQCRSNDICKPDLSVTAKLMLPSNVTAIHIGTVNDVTLMVDVKNKAADAAYLAQVDISYPSTFGYIGPRLSDAVQCITSVSKNGNETATCTVGNPLKGNSNKTIHIKFSTSELVKDFTIKIQAKSVNVDQNSKDNSLTIPVVVKFEADLEVLGSSVPDEFIYKEGKPVKIQIQADIGPKIAQTIIVQNNGPSKVDGAEVDIGIPSRYSNENDSYVMYMLQVELTGASGSCLTEGALNELKLPLTRNETTSPKDSKRKRRDTQVLNCRTTTCKSFKCRFGLLLPGEKAEVTVRSRLWKNTMLKKNPGVVDIQTKATVTIPDKRYTQPNSDNDIAIITLRVKPPSDSSNQKEPLAWWIILLAVMGGVLLLGIAAFILYKLGFFKRKRVKDISSPEVEQ